MNKQKRWIYSPPKPPKAKVPDTVKREVEDSAAKIIEGILKACRPQLSLHLLMKLWR